MTVYLTRENTKDNFLDSALQYLVMVEWSGESHRLKMAQIFCTGQDVGCQISFHRTGVSVYFIYAAFR